jgi:hypothetical protein
VDNLPIQWSKVWNTLRLIICFGVWERHASSSTWEPSEICTWRNWLCRRLCEKFWGLKADTLVLVNANHVGLA